MPTITLYPLGNADSILTELSDNRLLLVDYCDRKDRASTNDKRIDLPEELRATMQQKGRKDFDIVAFTHADDDHVGKSEEFFWCDHADAYQGNGRFRMRTMWVPANFVTEEGLEDSARVIRQEAKYRLKKGYGIRVFGNSDTLDAWLRKQGVVPESRASLITHAGSCVPEFSQLNGGVEFFVHSPFSFNMDDGVPQRNENSLVLHATFFEGQNKQRFMYGADATYDIWSNIIWKTEKKGRIERLEWDGFKISHHCSYLSLSDDKGKRETEPTPEIKRLFERGANRSILVSTSDPIPDSDTDQPPHVQAKRYYRSVTNNKNGEFIVTMENPTQNSPKPTVIEVTPYGLVHRPRTGNPLGGISVISRPAPEMGD